VSVSAITSINSLANQDDGPGGRSTAFQKTGQNLQSRQLDDAKNSASAVDTVKLSGLGQSQKLAGDVTRLKQHLDSGDLYAAQSAYAAIQQDLRHNQAQETASGASPVGGAAASHVTTAVGAAASRPDAPERNGRVFQSSRETGQFEDAAAPAKDATGRSTIDVSA